MTRAEVEKIFGCKANAGQSHAEWCGEVWEDDETGDVAEIRFDANDRVEDTGWRASDFPDDRTPLARRANRCLGRDPV
ncbi:MAG TPA: hypothetical protein VFE62_19025 [Gemmataceae bacterium]|nr:hypothetical protein [Gemmataceae bacterium]